MVKRVLAGFLAAFVWGGAHANTITVEPSAGGLTAHYVASWDGCNTCTMTGSGGLGVAFYNNATYGTPPQGLPFVASPSSDFGNYGLLSDLTLTISTWVTDSQGQVVTLTGGTWTLRGYDDGNEIVSTTPVLPTDGPAGQDATVYVNSTVTLSFAPFAATSTLPWDAFTDLQSYEALTGFGGYITLMTFEALVAVPEPASLGLLLTGLAGIAVRRRSART